MSAITATKPQALIIMDCQCAIIDNFVADGPAFLERASRTLDAARAAGVTVIYVVVGFRPGYPEVSPVNPMFTAVLKQGAFQRGDAGFAISSAIAPREDEIVIEKHRVSSFEGTDLDMILRARGIGKLALCGVMTSGCVLSTVRRAGDLDYEMTVISDLCEDNDPEVQKLLLTKIFPAQATVATAEQWTRSLEN